ncbi:MAG: hypothetical protein ACTSYB_13670, partial [Candidatus Helarchaeota archaeon]
MQKQYHILMVIILISVIFLIDFTNYFVKGLGSKHLISTRIISAVEKQKSNYLSKTDEFGYVVIYNVTLDKTTAEIGENITVSTVYTLISNPNYAGSGKIGVLNNNSGWFEYKNSLIDGIELYNVTELISIDPNYFDPFDNANGKVEIEIFEISNPSNFMLYQNSSEESLEIKKADVNYSLVEQKPLTIFSNDTINFCFLIHNEHTKRYVLSNTRVNISVINGNNSIDFSKNTDSNGFLNFTINCSVLGP